MRKTKTNAARTEVIKLLAANQEVFYSSLFTKQSDIRDLFGFGFCIVKASLKLSGATSTAPFRNEYEPDNQIGLCFPSGEHKMIRGRS